MVRDPAGHPEPGAYPLGIVSYPTVLEIVAGSPAAAADLAVGDELVAVNGVRPSDVIEYQQLVDDEDPQLTLRRAGLEWEVEVAKGVGKPLGLRLNSSIFDRVQTCDNHCEFCFIYQLPPGMRRSLYLKDDDYRLSFLYGNFTTLTRFTELDLARVVEERLGPLYVSIHATDPEVRTRMLRNRRGATSLRWLTALLDKGVTVHGQIVLCPGLNNGEVLHRTCAEVIARYPRLASVGIVPLGLSKFNSETALRVHTKAEAGADLDIAHFWQQIALERLRRRIFFASDEMYIAAAYDIPTADSYEGFDQHENGIGMARAFYEELDAIERGDDPAMVDRTGEWRTLPSAPAEGYRAPRYSGDSAASSEAGTAVVVTGEYGERVLAPVLGRLEHLAGRPIRLLPVRNEFFGGNVAVSGLLVGEDVRKAIANDDLSAAVYVLPDIALSGDKFLDEMGLDDLSHVTATPITPAPANASGLIQSVRI